MTKTEKLEKALENLLGKDRVVDREQDTTLLDEKGKPDKNRVADAALKLLEGRLPDCKTLKVGVNAFGKGAAVDVQPAHMEGLSRADRAEAVAALRPKLSVKDSVTSVEATFADAAVGQILAEHVGAMGGCDRIHCGLIEAAAVTGLYGKPLREKLLSMDTDSEPEKKSAKPAKTKPKAEDVNAAPVATVS